MKATTLDYSLTERDYRRPLLLGVFFSVLGEFMIFVVWGMFLYPAGDLLNKFLWTVLFCGVGMGSTIGAALVIFVVGRLHGTSAVLASVVFSVGILGLGCNLLCLRLDMTFHYFGGIENAPLFIGNGVAMSALGGFLIGWLTFTETGSRVLSRLGI